MFTFVRSKEVWGHHITARPLPLITAALSQSSFALWSVLTKTALSKAKPSQAKAKVLTGGGDLREAQVDGPLSVSHTRV